MDQIRDLYPVDKKAIDFTLLKLTKEELFIKAGYTENNSVYKAFLETQSKLPDKVEYDNPNQ